MAKAKKHVLSISKIRAETLQRFHEVASARLTAKSGRRSMLLSCSQYYCDEAADAVHDSVVFSKDLLPLTEDDDDTSGELAYETSGQLHWDDNGGAIFAFAALCHEEGYSDAGGGASFEDEDFDPENYEEPAQTTSVLALAQRLDDGTVRTTWLGTLHRPWLDFPKGMAAREDYSGMDEDLDFEDDPTALPALKGAEAKLYDQVLAHPDDMGARQVLCDAWTQRNDPRGTYGALCFSPNAVGRERAELVAKHGRSWLGPLTRVVPLSGALFSHGPFLEKAIVYADEKDFAQVAKEKAWATVSVLHFANESHRAVVPAMRNLREVGPLGSKELAAFEKGEWRVTHLDYEADKKGVAPLVELDLPLKRLSIRVDGAVKLDGLKKAKWFDGLERLELWLPPSATEDLKVLGPTLEGLRKAGPKGAEVRVGVLSGGARGGWVACEDAKGKRSLKLMRPDDRLARGPELAKLLKLTLDPAWEPEDDWLRLGLGVPA